MNGDRQAQQGEVYAIPLVDGRYGAIRILDVKDDGVTVLAGLLDWIGEAPPDIDEPALGNVLRQFQGGADGWSCAAWYESTVPPDFQFVGVLDGEVRLHGFDDPYGGDLEASMAFLLLENEAHRNGESAPDPTGRRTVEVLKCEDAMPLDRFWAVMDRALLREPECAAKLAPMVTHLGELPAEDIVAFNERLAVMLHDLDGIGVARALYGEGVASDVSALPSPDLFLYHRCGIVVSGRRVVEHYLSGHADAPPVSPCEDLLYAANRAWFLRTGEQRELVASVDYESFRNLVGWQSA